MSDSNNKPFDLDISGVAGFFGGDVSVSAMATVHIYEGRKWLGWYNQPGSYEIAKRYGQLSKSRVWDALYPGVNVDPAVLFEFDGKEGPKFTAIHSGTLLSKTGHLARLFVEGCKELPIDRASLRVEMRRTTPGFVTVANLAHIPDLEETPHQVRNSTSILAGIPMFVSLAACAACATIRDWYCFSIILLGIISSGVSCYVIGTGTLTFTHPKPADGAPAGDGILDGGGLELIVLKGPEGAVNAITRGQFTLKYGSEPAYNDIGVCAALLTIHFLAQLILIAQGTTHGQIFFLTSLAISWIYNSYLASFDRENIQRTILLEQVLKLKAGQTERYELGTRTSTAVFALLLLAPAETEALSKVLNDLLPNDTPVWRQWKSEVLQSIQSGIREGSTSDFAFKFEPSKGQDELLRTLYDDAGAAAKMYVAYRSGRPVYRGPSRASSHSNKMDYPQYYPSLGRSRGSGYSQVDTIDSGSSETLALRPGS